MSTNSKEEVEEGEVSSTTPDTCRGEIINMTSSY
jgi:hypothetical protein